MNNVTRTLKVLTASALCVWAVGCAKSSSGGGEVAQAPTPAVDDGRGTGSFPGGSGSPTTPGGSAALALGQAKLDLVGTTDSQKRSTLGLFFRNPPVNSVKDPYITASLTKEANGSYSGSISIGYTDSSGTREAVLSTNHPWNGSVSDSSPNVWFAWQGKQVFHGFFQDRYGAIVFVVDKQDDNGFGDGSSSKTISGEIWFQNFDDSSPYINPVQGPNKMCWQISLGPYDCRTFISGDGVDTYQSLYPNNYSDDKPTPVAYRKLGRFTGLDRKTAFGE